MKYKTCVSIAEKTPNKVKQTLKIALKKSDYVEHDPTPRVRYRSFEDSSIKLQFMFWIKQPVLKGKYKSFMIKDIHTRFKKEGIVIPYPILNLYVKNGKKNAKF